MKLADVKSSTYVHFNQNNNTEDPKFNVRDHERIWKYKSIRFQIGLKNFLWLQKLKILCYEHMLIVILTMKKLLEHFSKKNYEKQIKESVE